MTHPKRLALVLAASLPVLSAATLWGLSQRNDQAELLLEKAQEKELVDGQPEEAIRIYEDILTRYPENRATSARALVQMGQCYEKLGQDEARKAYERVLRDYADQNEAAAEARTRLAALRKPAGAGRPPELATRRIWGGPGVDIEGSVSADGRFLSFVDWDTGDLAVRDLETGTNRRLTNASGDFRDFALSSRISPDGRNVTYAWFNTDRSYDLRLIGLDGSGARVLHADEDTQYIEPAAWSPDGSHVLGVFFGKDLVHRIGLVSVADGSVRVLKTLDSRAPRGISFSPGGRYVAYDLPPQEDATTGDVFLLSTDGKRESTLIQHPANDVYPVWAPDGAWILFASDRTGSLGLWRIPVADGTPRGPAELVKQDVGGQLRPLGFSREGRYYYGLQGGMTDVYVASFDFQSGKLLGEPKRATERFVGSNVSPDWSPDGRRLAYVSHRGLSWQDSGVVCIRSLETGEERDLVPDLSWVFSPRWSPDGRSILLVGIDRQRRPVLSLMDVESGGTTPLVEFEVSAFPNNVQWARGGKAIVYRREESSTHRRSILVRELETGREEEIYRAPAGTSVYSFAVSPDGQWVVLRSYDEARRVEALDVVPCTGGAPRELIRAGEGETIPGYTPLVWSPDGSQILFTKGGTKGDDLTFGLWGVPVQGGEPREVGLTMEYLREVRLHPDGQRIAFAAGRPAAPEVWVMENVLPPTARSK